MTASPLARLAPLFKHDSVYVVGGAVRDRLLGRSTSDFDLALPGDPQRAAKRAADLLGGSMFALDEERGIFRVSLKDGAYLDITRFQGENLEADIDRRDFTVNALAVALADWNRADWKKHVIDRHGGLKDAAARRMRALGRSSLVEDPLRLLRAFRIAAELNFTIDKKTLDWIRLSRTKLKRSAPERIREELLRLFGTGRSYAFLYKMDEAGLLSTILPNTEELRRTAPAYYGKGGVLKHTLDSVKFFDEIWATLSRWFPGSGKKIAAYLAEHQGGHSRGAHCVWALLLHDIGKPATARKIDGRLRFFEHDHVGADMVIKMGPSHRWSTDETDRYARLVRNHMRPGNLAAHGETTDKAIHRFFRDLGDDAVAMLLVSLADHLTYLSPAELRRRNSAHELLTIRMIRRYYHQRGRVVPERVITGHDIMKSLGVPPSKLIGKLLTEVSEAQAEGKVRSRDDAFRFLKERAKSFTPEELGLVRKNA